MYADVDARRAVKLPEASAALSTRHQRIDGRAHDVRQGGSLLPPAIVRSRGRRAASPLTSAPALRGPTGWAGVTLARNGDWPCRPSDAARGARIRERSKATSIRAVNQHVTMTAALV
jgi:hypothetical protein